METQKNKSRPYWQNHVNEWSRSGLSQAEYSRQNNLSIRLFGYYKRRLFQTDNSDLVEIKNKRCGAGSFIELITPDGLMLRFREDISPSNFRNMIMSLKD